MSACIRSTSPWYFRFTNNENKTLQDLTLISNLRTIFLADQQRGSKLSNLELVFQWHRELMSPPSVRLTVYVYHEP
jgi:hypothetical protein